jgi:hypothetical protein
MRTTIWATLTRRGSRASPTVGALRRRRQRRGRGGQSRSH